MNQLEQFLLSAPQPTAADFSRFSVPARFVAGAKWDGGRPVDTRTFQQYDPSNAPAQQQLQPAFNAIADPLKATVGNDPAAQQRILEKTAQAMTDPMIVGAIKAFHGTPHTFPAERVLRDAKGNITWRTHDANEALPKLYEGESVENLPFGAFKKEAIGTGEGAAAYGHGASYSAEAPDVALAYRDTLSAGKIVDPESLAYIEGKKIAAEALGSSGARVSFLNQATSARPSSEAAKYAQYGSMALRDVPESELAQLIDAYRAQKQGHLLELSHQWPDAARETADPLSKEHLLDWDNSLSDSIKSKLKNAAIRQDAPERLKIWANNGTLEDINGQQFYSRLGEHMGSKQAASEYLHSLGIPGIKYLDGSSRGTGQGSHNFVMFEPDYTKIVARDGITLEDMMKNVK